MAFCSQCGNKLTGNTNFCSNCGKKTGDMPKVVIHHDVKKRGDDTSIAFGSSFGKTTGKAVGCFVVVFVILAIIALIIFLNVGRNNNSRMSGFINNNNTNRTPLQVEPSTVHSRNLHIDGVEIFAYTYMGVIRGTMYINRNNHGVEITLINYAGARWGFPIRIGPNREFFDRRDFNEIFSFEIRRDF